MAIMARRGYQETPARPTPRTSRRSRRGSSPAPPRPPRCRRRRGAPRRASGWRPGPRPRRRWRPATARARPHTAASGSPPPPGRRRRTRGAPLQSKRLLIESRSCQNRWHSLAKCDHGDSTTGRFDSPHRSAPIIWAGVSRSASGTASSRPRVRAPPARCRKIVNLSQRARCQRARCQPVASSMTATDDETMTAVAP
jgi:hypothetical protein